MARFMLLAVVAIALVASARACTDAANACGGGSCPGCGFSGTCFCSAIAGPAGITGGSCSADTDTCVECNTFGCSCTTCNPGCVNSCGPNAVPQGRRLSSFTPLETGIRALLQAPKEDPCAELDDWVKSNITEMYIRTSNTWCTKSSDRVGWLFFAHLLQLLDRNGDGKFSCLEWKKNRNVSVMDILKDCKPECTIRPLIISHAKKQRMSG